VISRDIVDGRTCAEAVRVLGRGLGRAGWVEFEVAERFAVEGDDSDVEIDRTCSQIDAD
jgi:hypothetical protein